EPEVLLNSVEIQRLVGHGRVDAETASIGTPQAAEHGNDLDEGRLFERRFDKLPALADTWECPRLLPGCDLNPNRPMRAAFPQKVLEGVPVGKAQDVIEIPQCIFRVTTGMRSSNRGDGPSRTQQVAQGVSGMSRLSERTDEDQIDMGRQFRQQIFKPCVADERNVMPLLPAPYTNYLWHDAGKIGIHHASIQSARRAPRNDIYDRDVEFSHGRAQPFRGYPLYESRLFRYRVSPFTPRGSHDVRLAEFALNPD